ncbi:hypothetical protein MUK42_10926 [Musa troglodytarum]|uniref:Uncharacterized protein n=2 Tax=Musa troglodytarum TaxID=320322 RepID=A0A9E7KG83_9LILI|nr:hypothetical protein MUK42_10926 [Musa troglodytarum]
MEELGFPTLDDEEADRYLRRSFSEGDAHVTRSSPALLGDGDSVECEERMDLLWEDLNEELYRGPIDAEKSTRRWRRRSADMDVLAAAERKLLVAKKEQQGSVELRLLPALNVSRGGSLRRKPGLVVMLRMLKNLFLAVLFRPSPPPVLFRLLMAAEKGFEDFGDVFGEATPEWDSATATIAVVPLLPSLFYAHAPDPSRVEVLATDFHSFTFARVLTVHDLEDLRDDIGIGGSWSEFVDYFKSSLSSGGVKLILGGLQNVGSGNVHATLIALKSKGLPRISLSLNIVLNVPASDAMGTLSLALFRAFKRKESDAVKGFHIFLVFSYSEHQRSSQLMESLSSERLLIAVYDGEFEAADMTNQHVISFVNQEKNDNLQNQLDSLSFLSKRKASKPNLAVKASTASDVLLNNFETSDSGLQQPSDIAANKGPQVIKSSKRGALVSRRPRVRGVLLQDTEDDDDN